MILMEKKEKVLPAFTIQAASLLLHWNEWYYESVLCLWAQGREPAFGSVERELSKYELRRGIMSERRCHGGTNPSVSCFIRFISFYHRASYDGETEADADWPCSTFLHTTETSSCAFNFTEFGQRQGNVIQLLAKTSSSMCILWTVVKLQVNSKLHLQLRVELEIVPIIGLYHNQVKR